MNEEAILDQPILAEPAPDVATLAALTLQGFLTAAGLHLGEEAPQAPRLARPDPQEAWRALLAADALCRALDPWLNDAFRVALQRLARRFAERHPGLAVPLPGATPAPPPPSAAEAGFTVGEQVAFAVEGALRAGALHLGEPGPTAPGAEPRQAWLALALAGALLDTFAPWMAPEALRPFQAGFARLAERFATDFPEFDAEYELPEAPRASLETLVASVIAEL